MSKVSISDTVVSNLIQTVIKSDINQKQITDALTHMVDNDNMELLITIITSPTSYIPLEQNSFIKFTTGEYNRKPEGDVDILTEHGVYTPEGQLFYGYITNSNDYSSDFNPYYYKMQVKQFSNNDKGEITLKDEVPYTSNIEKVTDTDLIKHLTSIRNNIKDQL